MVAPIEDPNNKNNLLGNDGSFEFNQPNGTLDNTTFKFPTEWIADSGTPFEIWGNGFNGQYASDGSNFLELDNGLRADSYSHYVNTAQNQNYTLNLDSMLRAGFSAGTSGVEVLWNGQLVGTFAPNDAKAWTNFSFNVVGTGGKDKLTIREVAGQSDAVGALLDNLRLIATSPTSVPVNPSTSNGTEFFQIKPADSALLSANVDARDIRDVNGTGNNLAHPTWGANDQQFVRLTKPDFGDGFNAPRGVVNGVQTLPNERVISNVISNQDHNGDGKSDNIPNQFNSDLFTMSFGQFFDHGLDFVQRSSVPGEKTVIQIPANDPLYNPAMGITTITQTRGAAAPGTGVDGIARQNINKTSPYVDQNQTYGSDDAVTYYLRQSARDNNGNLMYDANGAIIKNAKLLSGPNDASGREMLPTYMEVLLNNGVPKAVIDAAISANSLAVLQSDPHYIDFNNVNKPGTTTPSGHPLLLDISATASPGFPGAPGFPAFQVSALLAHYVGGDGRVNENIALTPIHTIWHREHDYWVDRLGSENPSWSQEKLFQSAKIIVEAEYQRVVFDEFSAIMSNEIPPQGVHGFSGYNPNVNATISAEFASAVYRVGHSQINDTIPFVNSDGSVTQISLVDAFLNPAMFREKGVDGLIKGSTQVLHQRIDEQLVNAVRNQLLGQASDLAALNLARGREVGIPSLNEVRRQLYENGSLLGDQASDYGRTLKGNPELKPYSGWAEFAQHLRDPSLVEDFKKVYGSNDADVNKVDLWIGGLAEEPKVGQMGHTFGIIFREQLDRLQDGDKFYYKLRLDGTNILEQIEEQSFADIIMRNSGLKHLQDQIFEKTKDVILGATEVSKTNTADQSVTIVGNSLNNTLNAGSKGDTLYGEDGDDILNGGAGEDGLRGGKGNDRLFGGDASDRLLGDVGDDYLDAGADNDAAFGGDGNDTLLGQDGNDELMGGNGNDTLRGGNGNDVIRGGAGDDIMFGENGDDTFFSGGGIDTVDTGAGYDRVVMGLEAGVTTVKFFDVKSDAVDLRLFGIHNIKELYSKAAITDDGRSTHIKIGASEVILDGVRLSSLTGNNFQYVLDIDNRLGNGMFNARPQIFDANEFLVDTLQSGGWEFMDDKWAMGWKNTNGNKVEIQREGVNLFLELDSDGGRDEVYQQVKTETGTRYALSFDTALRNGISSATSTVEVLWNNTVIDTFDPASTTWTTKNYEVVGTGGVDKLMFREQAGDSDHYGALLDNVNLIALAPVTPPPPAETLYQNGAGTQYVNGTTAQDVFVVGASKDGYQVNKTEDGKGVVIWKGADYDILFGVETIRFTDGEFKAKADGTFDFNPPSTNGTETLYQNVVGPQWLNGSTTSDVFVVNGKSVDFNAGATQDGKGVVIWNGDQYDILTGFETLRFTDKDVKADAKGQFNIHATEGAGGTTLFNDVAGTQYIQGTAGKDAFVVKANAADYHVDRAQDGIGLVVWKGDQYDVLHDVEIVRFNDRDVLATDVLGQ